MKQSRSRQPTGVPHRTVWVTQLQCLPVRDQIGRWLGQVTDVVAKTSDGPDLLLAGLLVALEDRQVLVPARGAPLLHDGLTVDPNTLPATPFRRGPTDLLLVADVLGHRLLDLQAGQLVRARDVELTLRDDHWVVAGVDVEWGGWWHRLKGRLNGHRAHRSWVALEPLTNTEHGPVLGHPVCAPRGYGCTIAVATTARNETRRFACQLSSMM
jgi:hypothetical protein